MMMSSHQLVRVRREILAACMTCPLCNKLLKEATTISECLHTFCRKCIYKKLTDEEVDCCPICNIDLGCLPVEKLRQDHNLQDVRSKIFPFKRRKVEAPETDSIPSVSLPARRKERSLSSLVVSTPQVSTQTSLTGRRTKSAARRAANLKGSNFTMDDDLIKKEEPEELTEGSSSPETLTKIAQNRRQSSPIVEPSNSQMSNKDAETAAETWNGKPDPWNPLNCLVEVANRTKSFKSNSQGSVVKLEPNNEINAEINVPKSKVRESIRKSKFQEDRVTTSLPMMKPRKPNGVGRKRASSSWELGSSAQAILDSTSSKRDRGISPIWFTLMASEDQEGDAPLPQISSCYLRIKNGNVPVSFIQKYLAKKLDLKNEAEVEIMCRGQPVVPSLQLHNLVDLWLQTVPVTEKVLACVGTSAKDFVMVLVYTRKIRPA